MNTPKQLTIADLLKLPVGAKIRARGAGLAFAIKTTKKHWALPDGQRIQQFLLTDATGDILADVKCDPKKYTDRDGVEKSGYDDLAGRNQIAVISGEIQATVKNIMTDAQPIKLFVEEYATYPASSEPEWMEGIDPGLVAFQQREIEGKCRFGIVCSQIRAKMTLVAILGAENKAKINEAVQFIKEGK